MNYKIAAYDVDFPHKAYGVQLGFMDKVLKALDSKGNALLEAPTGSGKTLSLLCAALAWQRQQKIDLANFANDVQAKAEPDSDVEEPPESAAPEENLKPDGKQKQRKRCTRIYYATRTHSQIAQVVRELKRTSYRPKMAILASREHYCIHPTISKKTNKDEECQNLLKDDSGCKFFKNVAKLYGMQTSHFLMVHDVEDLAKVGKDHKACPYYAATHFAGEADLIFCPYSYLLDPVIRSAMDITLENSVLIFDEAHNIEDTARDAASAELELDQLQEVQLAFQKMDIFGGANAPLYQSLADAMGWLLTWLRGKADANALPSKGYERFEGIWAGHQALAELSEAGLSEEKVEVLWDLYSQVRQAQEDQSGAAPVGQGVQPPGPTQAAQASSRVGMFALGVLSRLLTVLRLMYSAGAQHVHDYRLAVQRWFKHRDKQSHFRGRRVVEDDEESAVSGWAVQLCLWSLNPAVAFKELTDKARCVILTSGTLAPTDSFASELGASFPIKLEAPHVVDVRKQVWAGAISTGADGVTLQATYKQADTTAFQDSVGRSVVEVCKVVPDGVLMFLPSYSMLDRLMTRWKSNGIWGQLTALKKVVTEPKGTGDAFDAVMKEYCGAVRKGQGGLFMAVCRGKVSEGLDFADSNARAVLIFGIPFPNVKDTKVGLKKAYNDAGQRTHRLLSGDQWYSQQAFRALNQAIGRCIRHRADYGAIMLFDDRFRQARHQKNLSRWVRGTIVIQPNFQAALESLTGFFARLSANPPLGAPPPPTLQKTEDPSTSAPPAKAQRRNKSEPEQPIAEGLVTASQPTLMTAWAQPRSGSCASEPTLITAWAQPRSGSCASDPAHAGSSRRQQWQAAMSAAASAAAAGRWGQGPRAFVQNSPAVQKAASTGACAQNSPAVQQAASPASPSAHAQPSWVGQHRPAQASHDGLLSHPASGLPLSGAAQQYSTPVGQFQRHLPSQTPGTQPLSGGQGKSHRSLQRAESRFAHDAAQLRQSPQQPTPQIPGQVQVSATGPDGALQARQSPPSNAAIATASAPTHGQDQAQHAQHPQQAQHTLQPQHAQQPQQPQHAQQRQQPHHAQHALQARRAQQPQHAQQAQQSHDCAKQAQLQQHQQAAPTLQGACGVPGDLLQQWVQADLQAFAEWVSMHDLMQSQLEAETVGSSGILDCFDFAQEVMGSSALLKPFMEEWDGPLPRGFQAIAVAKGIALQQPFSLAPAVLHAMRQRLRHTSLAAALQGMRAGYQSCLAAAPSADPLEVQQPPSQLQHDPLSSAAQHQAAQLPQPVSVQGSAMPSHVQQAAQLPQAISGEGSATPYQVQQAAPLQAAASLHGGMHSTGHFASLQAAPQEGGAGQLASVRQVSNQPAPQQAVSTAASDVHGSAVGRPVQQAVSQQEDALEDVCCAQQQPAATHPSSEAACTGGMSEHQHAVHFEPHHSTTGLAKHGNTEHSQQVPGKQEQAAQVGRMRPKPAAGQGAGHLAPLSKPLPVCGSMVNASHKQAGSGKENAVVPVNPKRIHKSKAVAAAEADRESKRSKAVSAEQALAEAKAAALASGWDSDDDFEPLPRR